MALQRLVTDNILFVRKGMFVRWLRQQSVFNQVKCSNEATGTIFSDLGEAFDFDFNCHNNILATTSTFPLHALVFPSGKLYLVLPTSCSYSLYRFL